MTPDQIKEAAIAAAYAEFTAQRKNDNTTWRECVEAALDAYEAAMWRNEGPTDGTKTLAFNALTGTYATAYRAGEWPMRDIDMDGTWYPKPTHFRPLPQPPEVKHEPTNTAPFLA